MKTGLKVAAVSVVAAVSLAGLVGCSSDKGSKTTCGDYLGMSSGDQTKAVTKMLQDHGDSTANGNIALSKLSVQAYCRTVGSNSSTIDGVYGG